MDQFHLTEYLKSLSYSPSPVIGFYLYEWRDGYIPFYVGMGTNRRAWNEHLPLPENRRRLAANFRVHIIKHGLTKPQAHLAERYHISDLTKRGIILLNTRLPQIQ